VTLFSQSRLALHKQAAAPSTLPDWCVHFSASGIIDDFEKNRDLMFTLESLPRRFLIGHRPGIGAAHPRVESRAHRVNAQLDTILVHRSRGSFV
jgi:hypothetical protein